MKELRIGVAGMGVQGVLYAKLLAGMEVPGLAAGQKPAGCRLAAMSSRSEKARPLFEGAADAVWFSDWRQMIDSGLCDAVVITLPHFLHHEAALYALERGVHVLCEKPADVRASDVEKMLAAANGPVLAMMHNQRTNPVFRRVKALLETGELGELRRVNWISNRWWRPDSYYKSSPWRASWKGEGGGITVNQAPHQLDLLCWLCGEPVRVYSKNIHGAHRNIPVENDITVTLEYPNGATGVFVACTHDPLGTDRLELDLSAGKVVVENSCKATVYRLKKTDAELNGLYSFPQLLSVLTQEPTVLCSEETIEETIPFGAAYLQMFENFAAHIHDGVPLIAPAKAGLAQVRLANAIQLSGWLGQEVAYPCPTAAYNEQLARRMEEEKKGE